MTFSKRDWEKLIRKIAKDDGSVFLSEHVEVRMRQRKITRGMVLEVLRKGNIHREPEPDIKTGDTKCTMERYVAGEPIGVVVALENIKSISCLVITAFVIGG